MLMREICNACQVETKVLNGFRTAQVWLSGLKGCFPSSLSVFTVFLVQHCPLFCQTSSVNIYAQLSPHLQFTSPLLYAKPEETLRNLEKKRDHLLNFRVFHSVAGPSHFIQHQQITNNHLFTASRPLGTSPVLNQLYAHIVYNGKDSALHSLACTFFEPFFRQKTHCASKLLQQQDSSWCW